MTFYSANWDRLALSESLIGVPVLQRILENLSRSSLTASMLALSVALHAGAASKSAQAATLPDYVVPTSYSIFVEPHPEDGKFSGYESIDLKLTKSTRTIVLNSADIKIEEAYCESMPDSTQSREKKATSAESADRQKFKVHYQSKDERVILEAPENLSPGRLVLSLKYRGTLNDKSKGFFRASYIGTDKLKHWIAATQMEATDARRMFPCVDEPDYKATYKISTSIEDGDTAISNSPILSIKADPKSKRKIVTFEVTPQMSTYLVALVVGHLVPSKETVSEGVPIRVWATPGKEKLTHFSQELAGRLLTYYDKYFDIKYPAKKLDLIAIPDFSNGAMENLGAATFREDLLLVDESHGSLDAKQQAAINVAHEIAHMWFGDLVTMKWWDDLWLNEAFAEWMSTKAINDLQPSWHYWNQFASERDQSMLSDSLRATRAIHADVKEPDQIEQLFDEITYEKGASVMRMLERYVTPEDFRAGIRDFMKRYAFANATGENLWTAISARSGKDVSKVMHSWVYQEGYPLLSVESSTNSNPELAISQERFTFKRGTTKDAKSALWEIPLEIRKLENTKNAEQQFLITDHDEKLPESEATPLVMNAGGEGYYRVRYDANNLNRIAEHLDELTVLERASTLSDQFNLALSGQIPIDDYLRFTAAYKNENDPAVTSVLCSELMQMDLLVDDSSRKSFAGFVRDRLSEAKNRFGWISSPDDSDLVKRERAEVMLTMGTIGQDKDTIAEARSLAAKLFENNSEANVGAELIDPVLKIVAYNGDASDYAKIEALWHREKTPERELNTMMDLALFQDPQLMQKTLKMCLTDAVRKQDAPNLIAAIMESRSGRGVTWEFVRKHIIHLAWRLSGQRLFNIVMAMNALSTEQQLNEVQAFFKKHPVPSQSRGINKIIEAIEVRVAFRKRSGAELHTWLSNNDKAPRLIQISQQP